MRSLLWILLAAALLFGVAPFLANARPAEEILAEFDTVRYPGFVENISLADYRKLLDPPARRQCRLALELYRAHPDHPDVARLMRRRWTLLVNSLHEPERALRETTGILAESAPRALAASAHVTRAYAALHGADVDLAERFRLVKECVARCPGEAHWNASLIATLAIEHVGDPAKQRALCELATERFPRAAGRARLHLRLLDRIGEPVALSFTDLLTGKPAGLRAGRAALVYVWWPSEQMRPKVEAVRALRADIDLLFVYWGGANEAQVRAAAAEERIAWPLRFEPDNEDGWAWKLGVRRGGTFLLVDKQGKLAAAAEELAPLLPLIGRQ